MLSAIFVQKHANSFMQQRSFVVILHFGIVHYIAFLFSCIYVLGFNFWKEVCIVLFTVSYVTVCSFVFVSYRFVHVANSGNIELIYTASFPGTF